MYKPLRKPDVCFMKYNTSFKYTKSRRIHVSNCEYDVIKYCDGKNSIQCITYKLAEEYQACVSYQDIKECIVQLKNKEYLY